MNVFELPARFYLSVGRDNFMVLSLQMFDLIRVRWLGLGYSGGISRWFECMSIMIWFLFLGKRDVFGYSTCICAGIGCRSCQNKGIW